MSFTLWFVAGVVVGVLVGWGTAPTILPAVDRFREGARSSAERSRARATRTSTGRFVYDILNLAQSSHMAGKEIDLSEILIEPRFYTAPELIEPVAEDDVVQEVFYVVPRVPDYPYLGAAYNLEHIGIEQLSAGDSSLVLVGEPGSGRTTAMMAIALWGLGEIEFEAPLDPVQQRINDERARLSAQERKDLEKRREAQFQAAREKMERELGEDAAAEAAAVKIPVFKQKLPIYVHLSDLNISAREFGGNVDPAEPLVRAVQHWVRTFTARIVPGRIYRRLNEGGAIVLIDGYDDLPETEQRRADAWLRAFMAQYGEQNFVIVAGPSRGYGALTQMGLTPVYMRPWTPQQQQLAVDKWRAAWPTIGGTRRRRAPAPGESHIRRASENNHALNPAELTLKIWATFGDPNNADEPNMWLRNFLTLHLPKGEQVDDALELLTRAATLELNLGYISRNALRVIMESEIANIDDIADEVEKADTLEKAESEEERKAREKEQAEQLRLLSALTRSGMLLPYRGGRYRFKHSSIAAYLAGLTLQTAEEAQIIDLARRPRWGNAFYYAAMHTDISPAVAARLQDALDVVYSNWLEMARWMAFAPRDVAWRGTLLQRLGNAFIADHQFPVNRARIAAALVGARDVRGASMIFNKGLESGDPYVQRLSLLGLGALRIPGAVEVIGSRVYAEVLEVQLAAVMALGAIGTEAAFDEMVGALFSDNERLQQAVTETLAMNPDVGYPTLYEAVEDEDILVRRAAVFGLRRIDTRWAKERVHETFVTDNEFMVNSLAQRFFFHEQAGPHGPKAYPEAPDVGWIRNWARIRDFKLTDATHEALVEALQDDDEGVRQLAATALGQYGAPEALVPLYGALHDPSAAVRAAAYGALVDMGLRVGDTLPNPMN